MRIILGLDRNGTAIAAMKQNFALLSNLWCICLLRCSYYSFVVFFGCEDGSFCSKDTKNLAFTTTAIQIFKQHTDAASVYPPTYYFPFDIMSQERLRVIFTAIKVAIRFLDGMFLQSFILNW